MPRITEIEGNKTIVIETIDDTDSIYVRTMLQLAESRMLEAEKEAKIANIKMHNVALLHALQSGFGGYNELDIPVDMLEKLIKTCASNSKVVKLGVLTHCLTKLLMQKAFEREGLPYKEYEL